jgi:hypothetical protein
MYVKVSNKSTSQRKLQLFITNDLERARQVGDCHAQQTHRPCTCLHPVQQPFSQSQNIRCLFKKVFATDATGYNSEIRILNLQSQCQPSGLLNRKQRSKWATLSNYFKYPDYVRIAIYTTNAVKAEHHQQFRKGTKTKGGFANKNSLLKLFYAGILKASERWTHPIQNWNLTLAQLPIHFPGQLEKYLSLWLQTQKLEYPPLF